MLLAITEATWNSGTAAVTAFFLAINAIFTYRSSVAARVANQLSLANAQKIDAVNNATVANAGKIDAVHAIVNSNYQSLVSVNEALHQELQMTAQNLAVAKGATP